MTDSAIPKTPKWKARGFLFVIFLVALSPLFVFFMIVLALIFGSPTEGFD